MSRVSLVLMVGASLALAGLALLLGAHGLATTWQSLGSNAWGGETDPAKEWTYQVIGVAVLACGLLLNALAAYQWLTGGSRANLSR